MEKEQYKTVSIFFNNSYIFLYFYIKYVSIKNAYIQLKKPQNVVAVSNEKKNQFLNNYSFLHDNYFITFNFSFFSEKIFIYIFHISHMKI